MKRGLFFCVSASGLEKGRVTGIMHLEMDMMRRSFDMCHTKRTQIDGAKCTRRSPAESDPSVRFDDDWSVWWACFSSDFVVR